MDLGSGERTACNIQPAFSQPLFAGEARSPDRHHHHVFVTVQVQWWWKIWWCFDVMSRRYRKLLQMHHIRFQFCMWAKLDGFLWDLLLHRSYRRLVSSWLTKSLQEIRADSWFSWQLLQESALIFVKISEGNSEATLKQSAVQGTEKGTTRLGPFS